jgi:alpha-2-macroglobulin
MFRAHVCLVGVVLLGTAARAPGQGPAPKAETPLARAQRLAEQKPAAARWLGLAEMKRAAGQRQPALADLARAVAGAGPGARAAELRQLRCWRMLPLIEPHRADFRKEVAELKAAGEATPWRPVYEVYLAALERDRAALLAAVERLPARLPDRFPGAEQAHLELLQELGQPRNQAALEVLGARSYEPLHALRDLDRALTREAEFLTSQGRTADAQKLTGGRDRLRMAYLAASRHVIERLFALRLLGRLDERDALLARVKAVPYLTDPKRLAGLFERLDEGRAWAVLLQPLLAGEVAVVSEPPDLGAARRGGKADLHIRARAKSVRGESSTYEGAVEATLGPLHFRCERLTVVRPENEGGVVLAGTGAVRVAGVPGCTSVAADRFTFNSDTGGLTFGGDVRLDQPSGLLKLRACSVTRTGEVRDRRSLLDEFRGAFDQAAKLELLPQLTRVYSDDELPSEARYLLALQLLRPHLTWHAPYLPPPDDRDRRELARVKHLRARDDPWQEALGGDAWLAQDVPDRVREQHRQALARWRQVDRDRRDRPAEVLRAGPFFWRLRDARHADVARARRLLQRVEGELQRRAQQWLAEIRRNNTVLTFDVPGGGQAGAAFPLLMDVRNADEVRFKLYRVGRPEELLPVLHRIGEDFTYRDYGLQQFPDEVKRALREERSKRALDIFRRAERAVAVPPRFGPKQLVRHWEARVADLKVLGWARNWGRAWASWWDDREEDGWYFGDETEHFGPRLDKAYRPDVGQPSSWQCDRVVEVPGQALAQPGAYVLLAEANGQTASVPIVIDPLSLTLRRCRDGVFALVSDADGLKPLAGAQILGEGMHGKAVTDAEGAAFARLFAAGERAVVAHHQGRFAVGGFGRVFDGIYVSPWDPESWHGADRLVRARRLREARDEGVKVYADRHVLAAYTDRPTYRPGQEVQFKLIVRRLVPEKVPADGKPPAFRAEDFDAPLKFALPDRKKRLPYDVLDPQGRVVHSGTQPLSEFGTAAGKFTLNEETALGAYSLRVRVAGRNRVVPEVLAVKFYRRPGFEVELAGVPGKLTEPRDLPLDVTGRYYFGKPVSGGTVRARLVRGDRWRSVAVAEGALNEKGAARLLLRLPPHLDPGSYQAVCAVTDDSGRTVTRSAALEVVSPSAPAGPGLASVPRFVAAGEEFTVGTTADSVTVERERDRTIFLAQNGLARIRLAHPGWYRLRAAGQQADLFVYGGDKHPVDLKREEPKAEKERRAPEWDWVNLSDYQRQEHGGLSRCENPRQHLLALLDRQQVPVGDRLRVLVHAPQEGSRLLFTVEGRTVLDYVVVGTAKGKGPYHVVEIPIKQRYFPRFYLQGRVLAAEGQAEPTRPREGRNLRERYKWGDEDEGVDPPWCRVDVRDPSHKPGEERLNVRVEPDRREYRPGEQVKVRLKVTDKHGQPQSAEVSLGGVDESVYTFGEDRLGALAQFFATPAEPRRFLPKAWRSSLGSKWRRPKDGARAQALDRVQADLARRQLDIRRASDAARELETARQALTDPRRPVPVTMLGGELPVASLPRTRLREDFRETATWQPQLRTGPDGVAETSFKLPDSLTRYRLTAVALTKTSEVGTGRARLHVTLPLAVQLALPRFAVEKDRLLAVAVLHNDTERERVCDVRYTVRGAKVDGATPTLRDWEASVGKGQTTGTGRVTVPARGTARIGIWLVCDQIGVVTVGCHAGDKELWDAESRSLPVQPLGRPREVTAGGPLEQAPGKPQEKRVELPAGFVARDLRLSVAASAEAQALDGLEYLVGYPYGCIEQTMSRFLPSVMVAHAARLAPVELPPDVVTKLPDVLAKGLARVATFQHADGSWGWFDRDARNDAMTVYVVYGLARCRTTGTPVDGGVLGRGCGYLRGRLADPALDLDLGARAWHALALAGQADPAQLAAWLRPRRERLSPEARCNLALACREAGLAELGEQLWASVRTWQPTGTDELSLFLSTQIAYGAPYADCRRSSEKLLALRSGDRWQHTRATSWALEALAQMLAYLPERAAARRLTVRVDGRVVLDLSEPARLGKLVHRVRLSGERLPAREGLDVRITAEGGAPMHFRLRAEGVQRLDDARPTGTGLKVFRHLETVDGRPLTGAVAVGQVLRVRLQVDLKQDEQYLILEDRRPAGCEFADERLEGKVTTGAAHVDWRDDRVCVFFAGLAAGRHEVVYYLRAETPGVSHLLPGCVYPMYRETDRGETGTARLQVTERAP